MLFHLSLNHLLEFLVDFFFPNLEASFFLLADTSWEKIPCFVNSTCFVMVPCHLIVQILSPCIEHPGLNLIALNHVGQVDVLVSECKRLKWIYIPLVHRYLLPIAAKFVANYAESLKFIMTALVEARIFVQLPKWLVCLVALMLQYKLIKYLTC